jgi:diguanylate cyclase (GGDEF)-like protein
MAQGGSVLVVDDEEVIRRLLSFTFPEAGYTCVTASSAEAALEILKSRSFDFILVDIVMPGMSGLELTKIIKKSHPRTSVIVMTGYGDQFMYDRVVETGADDFLKKPFTVKEVLARIKFVMLRQDLHQWAVTDELTGVFNRKGFYTLARHLLKRARRTGELMYLLFLDLDNLKSINDTYGHNEGDLILIDAASILKENFRESDIVARMGGDEFVVFPVGSSKSDQEAMVSRFQGAIASYNAETKRPYPLSLSYGVSVYDSANPVSLDDLLGEADRAMYSMKKGKDQGR